MDHMVTHQEVMIVGGLAFLFVLYSVWMRPVSAKGLPDGYTNPGLALQLVKDESDIRQIVKAEDGKVREFLEKNLYRDFGYICVYALFFVCLSLLLSGMGFSWARWVGWSAATCAVLAAIMDLVENLGMLKAIKGDASDSLAHSIRYSSLAKWSFLFILSLLIGVLLIARRDVFVIPALLFLVAALLGMTGVILNLVRPRFYWTFPAAIGSMGLAALILAVAFTFWPDKLLNRFPPPMP